MNDLYQRARELIGPSPTRLDLSPTDLRRWSLFRAIEGAVSGSMSSRHSFEDECNMEIAARLRKLGRERGAGDPEHAFYIPEEVLFKPLGTRDLTAASAPGGGYLVATESSPSSFVELVRARSVTRSMGAITLPGLTNNVAICKQTGSVLTTWLSTGSIQIPESTPSLGQIGMSPKTISGYIEISRQLARQSNPSAEAFSMRDLSVSLSLAVDRAAINGSGASGQPLGLLNTPGIGSVSGASLDYADLIEMQTDVLTSGDDIDLTTAGSVATLPVAAALMQRVEFAGTSARLWQGSLAAGTVVGARAMSSNQLPDATMVFGAWSDLVIGEWGVLELEVNPFAGFQQGIIAVRGMYSVDVAVRRASSFSAAAGIS